MVAKLVRVIREGLHQFFSGIMTDMEQRTRISEWFINDGEYVPQVGSDVELKELNRNGENLSIQFIDEFGYALIIMMSENDWIRLVSAIKDDGTLPQLSDKPDRTKISEWYTDGGSYTSECSTEVTMMLIDDKPFDVGDRQSYLLMHPDATPTPKTFYLFRFCTVAQALEILLCRSDADRIVNYYDAPATLNKLFHVNP